jgi:4'-phosphopantetheinyl transferase EntD
LIETILPDTVAVAEAREDMAGVELFPDEEAAVARAVEKRRREFATGRGCAHRAMARLGIAASSVPSGNRGQPLWPPGIVGSITHCDGYRACAVARRSDLAALGVDAEPHAPLPAGLLHDVAGPNESAAIGRLSRSKPEIRWDRLLFSAKEAVFKAWFALTERRLEFEDAVIDFDPEEGRFKARLLVAGPLVGGRRLQKLEGRWEVEDRLILTAVTVSPA